MASATQALERLLLVLTLRELGADEAEALAAAASDAVPRDALDRLLQGDPIGLLNDGLRRMRPALDAVDDLTSDWIDVLEACAGTPEAAGDDFELGCFLVAVASLLVFVRASLTGPNADDDVVGEHPAGCLPRFAGIDDDPKRTDAQVERWTLHGMNVDGEDVVGRPAKVGYICTASTIFRRVLPRCGDDGVTATFATLPWWKMRALTLHQRVLARNAATLKAELTPLLPAVVGVAVGNAGGWDRGAGAAARIECALVLNMYSCSADALPFLEDANAALGIDVRVTGVMGKRTFHQVDPKAQMVVTATRTAEAAAVEASGASGAASGGVAAECPAPAPSALPPDWLMEGLDEEDILLMPRYLEDAATPADLGRGLVAVEQALLMGWLVQTHKGQAADELRSWEMMSYVQAIFGQERPCAFAKMAAALYAARFEKDRNRTRERSLVRMEKLDEVIKLPSPPFLTRLACAFTLPFPTLSSFQKEFGEQLIANAMVGSALTVFEKYEHWDNLITCYRLLGKPVQAQNVILSRLERHPNDPRLWCALGDVKKEDACYVEAWERSGHRHARAQRSLAVSEIRRDNFAGAIPHWTKALALNPLFPTGWFSLGYCYMREENEEKALHAFTRVTQLDPDNGEAYNNLAVLYIKRKMWRKAFAALKEAVRMRRESWQTWDNYVDAALHCGFITNAVHGIQTILHIGSPDKVSLASLEYLVDILACAKEGKGVGGKGKGEGEEEGEGGGEPKTPRRTQQERTSGRLTKR